MVTCVNGIMRTYTTVITFLFVIFTISSCEEEWTEPTLDSPLDGISLTVEPELVIPGTTDLESVTCTVQDVSAFGSLLTVLIYKIDAGMRRQDLINLGNGDPDKAHIITETDGTATGQFVQSGTSFLKLQWKSPSIDVAGTYGCEISLSVFDSDSAELVTFNKTHDLPYSDMNSLLAMIQHTQSELENLQESMDYAKIAMFYDTKVYNGTQFHISTFEIDNIVKAEAACNILKGQLAVPKDVNEVQIILDFARSIGLDVSLALGISDEDHEDSWVSRITGEPAFLIDDRMYHRYGDFYNNNCAFLDIKSVQFYDTDCSQLEGGINILCQTFQ